MITPTDFERMYRADADPWRVDDSWYERRKLAVTAAALHRPTYQRGWDTACGTGHLAAALMQRCEHLLATDAAPTACELTRNRLAGRESAEIAVHTLPEMPAGSTQDPFDLVVLSEVIYYLTPPDLDRMAPMLTAVTAGSAEILSVNWRHHPDDAYLSGSEAVRRLDLGLGALGWRGLVRHDDQDFILQSWRRATGDVR